MLLCMRTTLDIQDQLLIQAKKKAAETHQTLTGFIEDALRLFFEHQQKAKAAKPFKIRTFKGGGPARVDVNNTVALLDFLDEEEYVSHRRQHPDQRIPGKPTKA